MQPKVSVIIPFYSQSKWLEEALESVFSQTYTNIEVILVNDGSTEDISCLLEKYKKKISYIYQDNKGPGAARNSGIRIATGEYIAFEDSDDIWLPTKLEKQVAFMVDSGAIWSHTGFYNWWPSANKIKRVDNSRDYDDIYLQRYITTQIATPCVMLKKQIIEKYNFSFPEDVRNGEDGSLYTMLARFFPIALVQEPLVKVRMRGNNSKSHAIERFKMNALEYKKMVNSKESFPVPILFIHQIFVFLYYIFGSKTNKWRDFVAKCFWLFPYILQRLYVRYLVTKMHKKEKYIKRCL